MKTGLTLNSEICFIIQNIDINTNNIMESFKDVINKIKKEEYNQRLYDFEMIFEKKIRIEKLSVKNVKDFRKIIYEDLEQLIRALELYLAKYVDKIDVKKLVPEIVNLKPDYVINFNYTHTYERLYHKSKEEVFHIHGECDMNRSIKENNMVLGIDEYWSEVERDSHTNFTIFKKFAQRIQKHTDIDYCRYLADINEIYERSENGNSFNGRDIFDRCLPDEVSKVYVFGHSLDITDKDILSEFIGSDATAVTIYCYDKGVEGELIANTIRLIKEQRLLEKINYVPNKLEYIIQEKQSVNDEGDEQSGSSSANTYKKCRQCGYKTAENFVYCPKCGKRF